MSEPKKGTQSNPWPYSNAAKEERDEFRRQWIAENLEYAKEVEAKTGCPVSVTLAQAWYESHMGTAWPVGVGNNFWGVKCSEQWAAAHPGEFVRANDDSKNEPFRIFPTAKAAFENRAEILSSERYSPCRELAAGDSRGWLETMGRCGYYTADPKTYAAEVMKTIDYLDLRQYDAVAASKSNTLAPTSQDVAMPLSRENNAFVVTSPFGEKRSFGTSPHKGVDFRSPVPEPLFATEKGTIVFAGNTSGGGNTVTISYPRDGEESITVTYCHLSAINVKQGDEVLPGHQVGMTGNTGHSQGPHLHMSVKRIDAQGLVHLEDPTAYMCALADAKAEKLSMVDKADQAKDYAGEYWAQNGHIEFNASEAASQDLLADSNDIHSPAKQSANPVASFVPQAASEFTPEEKNNGFEDWLGALFKRGFYPGGSEGEAAGDAVSQMMKMLIGVFISASMGMPLDEKSRQAFIAARGQKVDLSALVPTAQKATMTCAPGKYAAVEFQFADGTAATWRLSPDEYDKFATLSSSHDTQGLQEMVSARAVSATAAANYEALAAQSSQLQQQQSTAMKV